MIVCAVIVSKSGDVFCPDHLPYDIRVDISKHATAFLYAISIEDDDVELPYAETTHLRYVYKQTEDLYWILVTKPESKIQSDVDLLGRFVCTIMEYGSSETNSKTITDEQRDLFYRHIWRPWDEDAQCPTCGRHSNSSELWEREFESRVQFLINIRDGHVDDNDVKYFNGIIAESWNISAKLSSKSKSIHDQCDSDNDSLCSSEVRSISEETVIDGCRLACRLEDIRLELKRIQDPYLRLFARRDLLIGSAFNQPNHISSAPSFEELDSTSQ